MKKAIRPVHVVIVLFAVVNLYPLVFVLLSSFKADLEIFSQPFSFPVRWQWENYVRAWNTANAGRYLFNSVVVTASGVVIAGFVSASAAYVLTRLKVRGLGVLFMVLVAGMFIPIHATMIPIAVNIARLELKDSLLALILTMVAFQIPITVFIISAQMKSLPREIEESAVADGAGNLRVFWSLVLPMSLPGISTASIFNFLGFYNNLIFPLLFISSPERMPIAYGLLAFFGERSSDFSGVMAAITIATALPLVVYIALQERLEESMTAGALKG